MSAEMAIELKRTFTEKLETNPTIWGKINAAAHNEIHEEDNQKKIVAIQIIWLLGIKRTIGETWVDGLLTSLESTESPHFAKYLKVRNTDSQSEVIKRFGVRPKAGFEELLKISRRFKPALRPLRLARRIEYKDYGTNGDWDLRLVDLEELTEQQYADFCEAHPKEYCDPIGWVHSDDEWEWYDEFPNFKSHYDPFPHSLESEPLEPYLAVTSRKIRVTESDFVDVRVEFPMSWVTEKTVALLSEMVDESLEKANEWWLVSKEEN